MKKSISAGVAGFLLAVSISASPANAQAFADPYANLDLADREALAARAQAMQDECVQTFGPQQSKCIMDCSRSARLARMMPVQRNKMFFEACVAGYQTAMSNPPPARLSPAAPAPAPAQPAPAPVASWTTPMPPEIVNAKPIAGAPDHVSADADNYLNSIGSTADFDKSCIRDNYANIRAAAYWKDMEAIASEINSRIRSGHAPATFGPVNADTVPALCKNEAFLDATSYGYPLPDGGHRLCADAARAPEADYVASKNNLGLKFPSICMNLNQIKMQEKNACMRSAQSRLDSGQGLGSFQTADDYCECSGEEAAQHFAGGDKRISSQSKVAARTQARTKCLKK